MERGRISKPKMDPDESSIYYVPEDFYVGGHVEFNSHKFILIDGDEYALKYMEKHADQVHHALVNGLLYNCIHVCSLSAVPPCKR